MATSQDYMKQLESMGEMPDYKQTITKAYESPVLKPIVGEAQQLESQYLPTIFNTFSEMGTGPADMSAAAKLQMIGKNLGSLGGRITSNRDIQNFYNMQITDLANRAAQDWQLRQAKLKDLYQMSFQNEEAARQEAARRRAAAAQAAAANAQTSALQELMNRYRTAGDQSMAIQTPEGGWQTVNDLNAYRALKNLPPVSQEYFTNTYQASVPGASKGRGLGALWGDLGKYVGGNINKIRSGNYGAALNLTGPGLAYNAFKNLRD